MDDDKQLEREFELVAANGSASWPTPALIRAAGRKASKRYWEFFAANIRNKNTRLAYYRALNDFFAWCNDRGLGMLDLEPIVVATYVEYLSGIYSRPTVKQHLAAIRMCFDWLVVGHVLLHNPAAAVRGPTHVVRTGKTPVLTAEQARKLIDSIETDTIIGLRDRAIISVLVFSFARVSALTGMLVEDYYQNAGRAWLRFQEKGGKRHEVPAHRKACVALNAYLAEAGILGNPQTPLFRSSTSRGKRLTENGMARQDVFNMVRKRALAAGLSEKVCCHTFRATGITAYLDNGGTIENAQAIAGHESPRTTKLYDRTGDHITLEEIERIRI